MKKIILPLLAFLLILACQRQPADNYQATGDPRFRTTQPSRIFFDNIRRIHYAQAPAVGGQPDLFTLRDFPEPGPQQAGLQVSILNHWLADEAYLRFVPVGLLPDTLRQCRIQWQLPDQTAEFVLYLDSPASSFEASLLFQELLQQGGQMAILQAGATGTLDTLPIFEAAESRQALAVVLSDYFRLIER